MGLPLAYCVVQTTSIPRIYRHVRSASDSHSHSAAYLCELEKFVGRIYDLVKAVYGWSCALTGACWVMIYRRAAILNCSSLNFVWISQRKKIVDSGVGVGMTADGI